MRRSKGAKESLEGMQASKRFGMVLSGFNSPSPTPAEAILLSPSTEPLSLGQMPPVKLLGSPQDNSTLL